MPTAGSGRENETARPPERYSVPRVIRSAEAARTRSRAPVRSRLGSASAERNSPQTLGRGKGSFSSRRTRAAASRRARWPPPIRPGRLRRRRRRRFRVKPPAPRPGSRKGKTRSTRAPVTAPPAMRRASSGVYACRTEAIPSETEIRVRKRSRPASETNASGRTWRREVEKREAVTRDAGEGGEQAGVLLRGEVVEEERGDDPVHGLRRRRGARRRPPQTDGKRSPAMRRPATRWRHWTSHARTRAGRPARASEPASRCETSAGSGADVEDHGRASRRAGASRGGGIVRGPARCPSRRLTSERSSSERRHLVRRRSPDRRGSRRTAGAAGRGGSSPGDITSALFLEPNPMQLQRACSNDAPRDSLAT